MVPSINIIKLFKCFLIFGLIIIAITIILIFINRIALNKNNKDKDINNIPNLPSNIISSKTYFKCPEKYHNPPTAEVLIDNDIERTHDSKTCDLYIPCGYNQVELEMYIMPDIKNTAIIYGIVGCDKIVSKNNIWIILEDTYGRNYACNYMPRTYVVGNDIHLNELKTNWIEGNRFILKKNVQRKRGLLITDSLEVINNAYNNEFKIIQNYINDPLLINKRKLNIRIYIGIVYKSRETRIYLYREGKCIYTNMDYIDGDNEFERNITSVNLNSDIYNKNPLLLSDLQSYLNNSEGGRGDKLLEDIYILMKSICNPIKPLVCNNYPKIIDNTCYQLFGADIIVTSSYKPLLLEFNKGPSMRTEIKRDHEMKKQVLEDTFKLAGVIVTDDNSHLNRFRAL